MENDDRVVKQFGKRLADLRNEAKISQDKLAEIVEVDRTYISLLERGLRNPTLKKLARIARALNISLLELVNF